MEKTSVDGFTLFYEKSNEPDAILAGAAISESYKLIQTIWDLEKQENIEVYVLDSWSKSLFHAASWNWKIYLWLTYPMIARKAQAIWPAAGGWAVPIGKKIVVAVKPRDLLQSANRKLGEQIYLADRNIDEIFQTVLCHELLHALTFHLKLPTWLHEGIAMLTMELYLGRPIIRPNSLDMLISNPPSGKPNPNQKLDITREQEIVRQYIQGYWVTRYIHETQPDLLRSILNGKHSHEWINNKVSQAYGKSPQGFWDQIGFDMDKWYRNKTLNNTLK